MNWRRVAVETFRAAGIVTLAGCGGGSAPAPQPAPAPQANAAAAAPAPAPSSTPMASAAPAASTSTKWIGGIPYDVFYDRPLEVASNQTQLGSSAITPAPGGGASMPSPEAAPAPTPTPTTASPSAAPAGGGGAIDWSKVATIEQVQEEISSLRNDLTGKLTQLGTYNSNWETIGVDATTLAALAGVVELHPGDVSWKAHARVARKLASDINLNAVKTGRSAFDATKAPFESLIDLLSGNPPAGIEANEEPFGDYADRSTLMKRIEVTLNGLKANINTEDRLKEDPATVKRKLAMLATLMSVVATPSYEYAEEPEYRGYVDRFVGAALSGREAVDGSDFSTFTGSLGEMQKICGECHQKYAFGGSSF